MNETKFQKFSKLNKHFSKLENLFKTILSAFNSTIVPQQSVYRMKHVSIYKIQQRHLDIFANDNKVNKITILQDHNITDTTKITMTKYGGKFNKQICLSSNFSNIKK